jgi:hypothetical protein
MASRMWAAAAYAAWMAGDMTELGPAASRRFAVSAADDDQVGLSQVTATIRGNFELFEGRLRAAAEWYRLGWRRRPIRRNAGSPSVPNCWHSDTGEPHGGALADAVIREVGDVATAPAAYVWYCAGEAVMLVDVDLASARFTRSVELAE